MRRFGLNLFSGQRARWFYLRLTAILIGLLGCLLIAIWTPLTLGEKADQTKIQPKPGNFSAAPPLVHAPVHLDGRILFEVAAAETAPPIRSANQSPIEDRAKLIEANFRRVLKVLASPKTLDVVVETDDRGYSTIIAAYTTTQGSALKQVLLTITPEDARLYGIPQEDWADLVARRAKTALTRAKQERQLDFLLQQGWIAVGIGSVLLVANVLMELWQRRIQKQLHPYYKENPRQLRQSWASIQPVAPATAYDSHVGSWHEQRHQQRFHLEKINRLEVVRRSLNILQVTLWLGSLVLILGLFPYTRFLKFWLLEKPAMLLGLWFGSQLILQLLITFIDERVDRWIHKKTLGAGDRDRQLARAATLTNTVESLLTVVVLSITALGTLNILGIPLGWLFAGVGVLILALSFAYQTLVQDIINGCLVLLEDQYAIGDWLVIEALEGQVEAMNLRMTQLRGLNGQVITIPNSNVKVVRNITKNSVTTQPALTPHLSEQAMPTTPFGLSSPGRLGQQFPSASLRTSRSEQVAQDKSPGTNLNPSPKEEEGL